MLESDREQFAILMVRLGEIYGPSSDARIDTWWAALRDQPIREIESAIITLIRSRPRIERRPDGEIVHLAWPTPAELLAVLFAGGGEAEARRPAKAALAPAPPEVVEAQRQRVLAIVRSVVESLPAPILTRQERIERYRERRRAAPSADERRRTLADLIASGASDSDVAALAARAGYTADEISAAYAAHAAGEAEDCGDQPEGGIPQATDERSPNLEPPTQQDNCAMDSQTH